MSTRSVWVLVAAVLCLPVCATGQVVPGQADFQTFAVPGNIPGLANLDVSQISDTGFVAGYLTRATTPGYSYEGIVRDPNGKITDLDDPQGDSPTYGPWTEAQSVNGWATVAGIIWVTATSPNHFEGFFYSSGKFDNYNVPGLPVGSDTLIYGVNDFGAFCGFYGASPTYDYVPFVNFAGQMVTNFNLPGAPKIPGTAAIYPLAVNDLGQVAGSWYEGNGKGGLGLEHGFVRNPDGKIIEIDVPGAGSLGTQVQGVNNFGWVSGHYWEGPNNYEHGFVLSPKGVYYQIDVPGAATNLAGGGTGGGVLNDQGVLAGHYDPKDLSQPERGYIAALKFYPKYFSH